MYVCMYVHVLWLADFDPLCQFWYFCGHPVATVIMIDGSKTCESLLGAQVRVSMLLKGAITEKKLFSYMYIDASVVEV